MIKEKLEILPNKFKKALPLMYKLQSCGFEVYFVGGSLRDLLLNKQINDIDIATSALPLEVKKIFPHSFDTGIQHGTITVLYENENYEITTFRTDGDYLDHRHPKNVEFVRSLKEDIKRRDFTINALAMSPQGEIIDYYNGIKDLKDNTIKCVLNPFERFEEDALRIFRAIRFASQLNFNLEEKTYLALLEKVPLLSNISIERIHNEFIKMMMGQNWQKGFNLIIQTKTYEYLPGFQLENIKSLFNSILNQIIFLDESTIWAALFYLEIFSSHKINDILTKWKTSNEIINNVKETIDFCHNYQRGVTDYHLVYGVKKENIKRGIFVLENVAGKNITDNPLKKYDMLPIHGIKDINITGSDLIQEAGFTPGISLGKMIKLIEKRILEHKLENDHQILINFARENNV